jgi:hypothetical protein
MLKDKATETNKLKVELGKLQDRIDEETFDIRKQTIKAEFAGFLHASPVQ